MINQHPPLLHRRPASDHRSNDDIWKHYQIERQLADRLRNARRDERLQLYPTLYNEIFERVPNIPGWNDQVPAEALAKNVASKIRFLERFTTPESTFLEIGAGDCSVSLAMAGHVQQVYAVDVSTAITGNVQPPENFQLLISDGVSIGVPPASVDVAYSSNLMEHLHPDDAVEQLRNILRALKPGGVYICITPSKLSGPHDVSKYFDEAPTGFHLREYSTTELAEIFTRTGFARVRPYVWIRERLLLPPLFLLQVAETCLQWLPRRWYRYICNRFPVNYFLARVIAYAPAARDS
jgi:SAM-dependent methyltransferase